MLFFDSPGSRKLKLRMGTGHGHIPVRDKCDQIAIMSSESNFQWSQGEALHLCNCPRARAPIFHALERLEYDNTLERISSTDLLQCELVSTEFRASKF
jgi:hypothetical protein